MTQEELEDIIAYNLSFGISKEATIKFLDIDTSNYDI